MQPSKNASVPHMAKTGSDTRREGKKDRKKDRNPTKQWEGAPVYM